MLKLVLLNIEILGMTLLGSRGHQLVSSEPKVDPARTLKVSDASAA